MFNLRDERERKGLTLLEVAKAASVSESYISYVETGKRRPSVDVAKRIAKILGFNWTKFYQDK